VTEPLFVNADWSALVLAGSPEAAYGIQPKDAKRLGLLAKEPGEVIPEPEILVSANPAPEPELVKEAKKPADKSARKPKTK